MSNYEHVVAALDSGELENLAPSDLLNYLTSELEKGNTELLEEAKVTTALSAVVLPDVMDEYQVTEPGHLTEDEVLNWMADIGCHEDDELQMALVGAIIDL